MKRLIVASAAMLAATMMTGEASAAGCYHRYHGCGCGGCVHYVPVRTCGCCCGGGLFGGGLFGGGFFGF